jgi:hypothetical protein
MKRYWAVTRTHSYSLLFALPLLLLYEAGAVYIARAEGSSLRNGADVLLRTMLAIGGLQGTLAFTMLLVAGAAILVFLERRRKAPPLRLRPFFGMAAESAVYALLLGLVVGTATSWLVRGISVHLAAGGFASLSLAEGIVLSLGAGVYEELVFRVILVGGLFGVFRAGGLSARLAGVFSVILAAMVFSGFHYVGPYGDPWEIPSFLFRFLAGVVFSVLFLVRGFGITAWTHALYDVFLVLALNR